MCVFFDSLIYLGAGSLLALLFSGNNSKLPTDSKQLREWHCLTNPDGDKEGDEEGTWFAEPDENEENNSNKRDKNKPVEKYCKIHKAKGVPPPVKDFLEKQNNENKASVWDRFLKVLWKRKLLNHNKVAAGQQRQFVTTS